MADIEWKPLPTGLWTPPAVFAEVGNLLLQTITDDGVPTWEISKKRGNGANGTSSPRALPTPSRQPKRRRSSKRKQHRGDHKGGMKMWSKIDPVVGVVENGTWQSQKVASEPSANQG
jgi:hypothetical protein